MPFVSGNRMFYSLFKLEQIYKYNGIVINNYYSFNNDRVWPRNHTITDCRPTQHGTVRKGHNVGIVQALTVQYRYIPSSFSFQCE